MLAFDFSAEIFILVRYFIAQPILTWPTCFPPLLSLISYANRCISDDVGTFARERFSCCTKEAALIAMKQAWFPVIVLASGGQNCVLYSFMAELCSDS